ncbi:MAG: winged helix-turn-helix transcriptional regulator [Candidatus Moranbacteria bacterium]|nr:winged helix-turn-helix transcriptional regulator [Candidatus Moranbacteria bacterium]
MYTETLQDLGLARNEARIFETLIKEGILSIGEIASHAGINRRNVYDSINRLTEKGLVFELIEEEGSRYEAVEPDKLMEMIKEKENALSNILPELRKMYDKQSFSEAVYIYKGVEGYKTYMRDILRVGQDVYVIGGKGTWADDKLKPFTIPFMDEMKKRGLKMYILFEHQVMKTKSESLNSLKKKMVCRYLSKEYSTSVVLDIFGNRTLIFSHLAKGNFDEDASFTVIVNQQIADAFRVWFKALWTISKK